MFHDAAYTVTMSNLHDVAEELRNIIHDTSKPVEVRAAQITDDIAMRYGDLFATHPGLQAIGQMAGKIKASGATEGEDGVMWAEVIHQVHILLDS